MPKSSGKNVILNKVKNLLRIAAGGQKQQEMLNRTRSAKVTLWMQKCFSPTIFFSFDGGRSNKDARKYNKTSKNLQGVL